MEIIRQLTDEQLTDLLLAGDEHVLQNELPAIAQAARTATDFEEPFWRAQQQSIQARILAKAEKRSRMGALVWALAGALILFGALTLDQHSTRPSQAAKVDPDQQLMMAVENAVDRPGPMALEPAGMLASEINQAYLETSTSSATHKENDHAN